MATQAFVDLTGLQYYDGKLQERIAGTYATKAAYVGATSSANGTAGLVPAASSAQRGNFLRGDGTWTEAQTAKEIGYSTSEPTTSSTSSLDNESVIFYETQNMAAGVSSVAAISISGNASTADSVNHSMSISVDGGAVEGASLYTFNGSAEKTMNIAGGTGISLTGVSGTVTINANPFRGATASVNGAAGMVPASTVAEKDMFLKGDGTWAEISLPDVYQGATGSSSGIAGLVPAASSAERERFLKGDGTWAEVVQPAIVTSSELSTGTDATVRTISPKVIHDYVAGEVAAGVAGLVNSAPATLDTLNELAAALGNDANFATTVSTNIGTKVSKTGDETIAGVKTFSSTISGSIDGNAATATKATQDASGNVITTTYATKNELPADYIGATANANGTHGLVPAATSAQKDCYLAGNGSWTSLEIISDALIDELFDPYEWKVQFNSGSYPSNGMKIPFCLYGTTNTSISVDWGDGSAIEEFTSATAEEDVFPSHTYSTANTTYTITFSSLSWRRIYICRLSNLDLVSWQTGIRSIVTPLPPLAGTHTVEDDYTSWAHLDNVLEYTFYKCNGLTTIPAYFLQKNPDVTSLSYCFAGCSSIATVPNDLLSYSTSIQNLNRFMCQLDHDTMSLGGFEWTIPSASVSNATDIVTLNSSATRTIHVPSGSTTATTLNAVASDYGLIVSAS